MARPPQPHFLISVHTMQEMRVRHFHFTLFSLFRMLHLPSRSLTLEFLFSPFFFLFLEELSPNPDLPEWDIRWHPIPSF